MSTEYPGNAIPAPGFQRGNVSVDDELLASTARFTQKGVTLKAGQGVLPLGTALARETSSKRYVKYASGGTGGTNVIVGLLRQTVDTGAAGSTQDFQNNVVMSGIVVASKVAAANGGDAAAIATALNGRVDAAFDYLVF